MYFHKVYTDTLPLHSFSCVRVRGGKQCSVDSKSIFCTLFWAFKFKCCSRFQRIEVGLPFNTEIQRWLFCNVCDFYCVAAPRYPMVYFSCLWNFLVLVGCCVIRRTVQRAELCERSRAWLFVLVQDTRWEHRNSRTRISMILGERVKKITRTHE